PVGWLRPVIWCGAGVGRIAVILPLAGPATAFWLLAISFFLGGMNGVMYNIDQIRLRQAITPEHLLGRMNATMRFLVWGTIPVGSVIGAALSETVGVRTTIWISAILSCLAFLPVLFSKVRSIQTIPTGEPGVEPADERAEIA